MLRKHTDKLDNHADGHAGRNRGGQMSSGTGPPGPEKATPRLDSEAARKVDDDDGEHIVHFQAPDKDIARLRQEYLALCEAQAPFERIFWQIEERKGQLADQLANEGVAPFCRPRRGGQRLRKRFTRKDTVQQSFAKPIDAFDGLREAAERWQRYALACEYLLEFFP